MSDNMYAGGDQRGVSIEQLVKESTQELLIEPDFSKFIDLVDAIGSFGKSHRRARCVQFIQAVARRLESKKRVVNVVYLCFHLIDFAVKNLQPEMPRLVASPTLQKVIVKVGKARTTKGRALAVVIEKVQEWSYIFQHLGGFQETYIALQKAGVQFPMPSKELVAEQTKVNMERIERAERVNEQKRKESPEGKLEQNLLLLEDNLLMVSQMLAAVDPTTEEVSRHELIPPLITSISQQRPKVADLIVKCTDESLMGTLLKVNDDINNCMEWYQQLLKGQRPNFPEYLLSGVHSPDRPAEPPRAQAPPQEPRRSTAAQPLVALEAPPANQSAAPPSDPFAALASRRATNRGSQSSPAAVTAAAIAPAQTPVNPLDALFGISSAPSGQPAPMLPQAMAPQQPLLMPMQPQPQQQPQPPNMYAARAVPQGAAPQPVYNPASPTSQLFSNSTYAPVSSPVPPADNPFASFMQNSGSGQPPPAQ